MEPSSSADAPRRRQERLGLVSKLWEVNWSEGLFLRPQHLQVFARHLTNLVTDTWRQTQPFLWGLTEVEIATDQLEAFTFAVRRFDAVLKDGTRLHLPSNLRLDPRDFKDALNAAPDGKLQVFVGVPVLREGEPNTVGSTGGGKEAELRYRVDTIEVADENLGGAAQLLEVRKHNGRVFLGSENREGYECLPVALIQCAGYGSNQPGLSREFIPPVVDVSAWPALAKLAESVLHRVEAKHQYLRAELSEGRIVLDAAGSGGWQPILKLQIVGSFLHVLRQLTGVSGVHPFQLYLEFSRLAGELGIFEEEGADSVRVPLYDHDRLGECFNELVFTLERLLERILSGRFIRVDFQVEGELLIARLRPEWAGRDGEIYLNIESDLDDRAVLTRIETAKIGAPADLPILKQRRLFGLDIELLKRTPGGLPARENLHYFTIAKEGPYWESVARSLEVAVSGGIDPRLKFSLYIVLRPEGGTRP